MKNRFIILPLTLLPLWGNALAEYGGINYTHLDVGYQSGEIDLGSGIDLDFNTFGIIGSYNLSDTLYIHGSYGTGKIKTSDFGTLDDTNIDVVSGGFGFIFNLSEDARTKADVSVSVGRFDVDGNNFTDDFSDTEDSFGMRIRHLVPNQSLETFGEVEFSSGEHAFAFGALAMVSNTFKLGVQLGRADDVDTATFFVRLSPQ